MLDRRSRAATRSTPEMWVQLAAALERASARRVGDRRRLGAAHRESMAFVGHRRGPVTGTRRAELGRRCRPAISRPCGMRLIEGREFRTRRCAAAPGRVEAARARRRHRQPDVRARVLRRQESRSASASSWTVPAAPMEIVGMVADAVYSSVREARHPAVYIPLEARTARLSWFEPPDGAADLQRVLRQEVVTTSPGHAGARRRAVRGARDPADDPRAAARRRSPRSSPCLRCCWP